MYYLLLGIHILVCIFLIIVVLLQSGKAADLAGAFGGMGSQTAFGPRGSATLLSKATTISTVVFMLTSISAERQGGGFGRSVRRNGFTDRLRPAWFGNAALKGDDDLDGGFHADFDLS